MLGLMSRRDHLTEVYPVVETVHKYGVLDGVNLTVHRCVPPEGVGGPRTAERYLARQVAGRVVSVHRGVSPLTPRAHRRG